jgi:hypothetical protein
MIMFDSGKRAARWGEKPRDARSFACQLIDRLGERAGSYAVYQALKASARGDWREAARWRWIAEITNETLRSDVEWVPARQPEV